MTNVSTLTGERLDGKYLIDRKLGEGGMGAVYLARHLGTKRPVAIKVIAPTKANDANFVERFRREAEVAGSLRHPNVVNVTDFGYANVSGVAVAYLVMEYLDGCSLADILAEEGALPLDFVVGIVEQVCSAVEEAHRLGIIHRDLKPQNIWLEPNRRGGYTVKVLDFGLAKIRDSDWKPVDQSLFDLVSDFSWQGESTLVYGAEPDGPAATGTIAGPAMAGNADSDRSDRLDTSANSFDTSTSGSGSEAELTQVGTVLGTPQYMSPEQCRGFPLDGKTDIYGIGIVTYEMLTGRRPFDGDRLSLMVRQVTETPVAPAELSADIPHPVSDIVMRALEKNPADRPDRASTFASMLKANSEGFGAIAQRAFAVFIDRFPIFLRLFLVAYSPIFLLRVVRFVVSFELEEWRFAERFLVQTFGGLLLSSVITFLSLAVLRGVSALLLTQLLLAPLRKLRLNLALGVLKEKLPALLLGSLFYFGLVSVPLVCFVISVTSFPRGIAYMIDVGFDSNELTIVVVGILGALGFGFLTFNNFVSYSLFPIVLLVEKSSAWRGLKRSKELVSRSRASVVPAAFVEMAAFTLTLTFAIVLGALVYSRFVYDLAVTAFAMCVEILAVPLVAIIYAMLYLKLRQSAGESIDEMLDEQYVQQEIPKSKWQMRMQRRLH